MSRRNVFPSLLAVAMLLATAVAVQAAPAAGQRQRVIVVFEPGVANPAAAARDLATRHGARVGFVYRHALKGFSAEAPAAALRRLARDARVRFVELDQQVEAFGHSQGNVPNGVNRVEADKNTTAAIGTGASVGVDVAIIDTGIDHNHPDLNVVDGTNCASGGPFNSSCKSGLPGDGNGHGTHVAGTAAAKPAGAGGVHGMAPGARLHAVKVLGNDGSGWISWIVAGVDWVTARASTIEVANMSLGCECSSGALDTAITNSTSAGVVYVVAAGNSAKNASTFSPANHSRVIAVSAMADFDGKAGAAHAPTCRSDVGSDDTFATFSNFGSVVDLAAPGVCVLSTWPGGGYNEISGTSMASPHGAGAAALYVVQNNVARSSTRWQTVRNGLQSSGWSVPQGDACGFTGGKSSERFLMLAACDSASGDGGGGGDDGGGDGGEDPALTTVSVDSISYARTGGGGRHLLVTVLIEDENQNPVSGATVAVELYRDGSLHATGSGTTGSNGTVTFRSNNAPSGCYTTTVTDVQGSGLSWDGVTPPNSSC